MNVGRAIAGVGAVVGLVGLGLLGLVVAQPSTTHVERSRVVAAPPEEVFPLVNDFRRWIVWNPWLDLDPSQKTTLSENPVGAGAWYTWEGNDQVGKGRMAILSSVPDREVVEELQFLEPFASTARITFTFAPEAGGTKVVWAFDGENDLMGKAFGLVVDMDTMLGADFERGLGKMATELEKVAKERAAAAAAEEARRVAAEAATGAEAQAAVAVP